MAIVRGQSEKTYCDRLGVGLNPDIESALARVLIVDYKWSPALQHMWAAPKTGSRLPYSCIQDEPFGFCELLGRLMWVKCIL